MEQADGTYTGKVSKDGLYQGQGVIDYRNGDTYDGSFKGGKRHGWGRFTIASRTPSGSGDMYEGEWAHDAYHGKGRITTSMGTIFEGQFESGRPHGHCEHRRKDGCLLFSGEYVSGVKQGIGTEVFQDRSVYTGEFENNVPHGLGECGVANRKVRHSGLFEGGSASGERYGAQ